jgi:hypothetical protein
VDTTSSTERWTHSLGKATKLLFLLLPSIDVGWPGLDFTVYASVCEGLLGVYLTIWCLCYKINELKKKKQKKGHWA